MVVTAWALVARGCELGRAANKEFTSARGLRWCDIEWFAPGKLPEARGYAACLVHICAAKDVDGTGPRYPIPVRRRARPGVVGGGCCAFDELSAAFAEDVKLLGRVTALAGPVFRRSAYGGAADAVDTNDVSATVKLVARAAGCDPDEFGAHSPRIGAATDTHDEKGAADGARLLKARGRWRSDIHEIYTRASLAACLEASVVGDANGGRELEAAVAGFTQPAR